MTEVELKTKDDMATLKSINEQIIKLKEQTVKLKEQINV